MKKAVENTLTIEQLDSKVASSLSFLERQCGTEIKAAVAEFGSKLLQTEERFSRKINAKAQSSERNILLLAQGAAKLKDDLLKLRG
jgi:hypothetical protein